MESSFQKAWHRGRRNSSGKVAGAPGDSPQSLCSASAAGDEEPPSDRLMRSAGTDWARANGAKGPSPGLGEPQLAAVSRREAL